MLDICSNWNAKLDLFFPNVSDLVMIEEWFNIAEKEAISANITIMKLSHLWFA